jgi:hypothetical protein
MPRRLFYILLLFLLGSAQTAWASEARVNAAGGLSLVMDDDVYTINPFVLGDPAGLALISPVSRLDVKTQWFEETDALDNFQRNYLGTVPDLTSNTRTYKGLIFFPTDRWAVQVDADYLYSEGALPSGLETAGNNRTRQLLRTAYDFGPFVLGTELVPTQTFSPVTDQFIGSGEIVSGEDRSTIWSLNSGLLINFPENPTPQQERLRIGGVYSYQLKPPVETANLSIIPTGFSTASPVTATITDSTYQSFGPEIYFDVPGSFQAALVTRFTNLEVTSQAESPDVVLVPDPSPYKSDDGTSMSFLGALKCVLPLGGLRLKSGGILSFTTGKFNVYDRVGPLYNGDEWSMEARVGAGIEEVDHFTVGFQGSFQRKGGTLYDASGTDIGDNGFMDYSVFFGGENWIKKDWAIRIGFGFENQFNSGNVPTSTYFWPSFDPGVRLLTNTITLGTGYKDKGLYSDLTFSYGQPVRYDSSDPRAFAQQIGVQWAMGVFFN